MLYSVFPASEKPLAVNSQTVGPVHIDMHPGFLLQLLLAFSYLFFDFFPEKLLFRRIRFLILFSIDNTSRIEYKRIFQFLEGMSFFFVRYRAPYKVYAVHSSFIGFLLLFLNLIGYIYLMN